MDEARLASVLLTLPRITVEGVFWRTVADRYLQGPPPGAPAGSAPQPLWPGGAALRGSRYTPIGGPDALYLAPDGATALAQVEAVIFSPNGEVEPGPAHDPLVVFAVQAKLPDTLDLGDPDIQGALQTSEPELTAPWLRAQERHRLGRGPLPPTQALGGAAARTGEVLALRYPAYRRKGALNLVVFTDSLARLGGRVVLVDTSGTHAQTLP